LNFEFYHCIPASSTTKTGHDIAEILLKVALNTKAINQSINQSYVTCDGVSSELPRRAMSVKESK
jgi:hypothetical protein